MSSTNNVRNNDCVVRDLSSNGLATEKAAGPATSTVSDSPSAPQPRVRGTRHTGERRFQQGLFAYHRGDYSASLADFEKASESFSAIGDHARFVEACTYILRILAEREEFSRIERIEAKVIEILAIASLSAKLKARALYILGICNCYQESRHEQAMVRFREAIDQAVASGDKEALAGPLYGAATVLYARRRFDEALKELGRLEILLSCISIPEIGTAASLLRAMVRRNQGRLDEALESAWTAYENLKHHPHLVLYLHTLCVLGTSFLQKGDSTSARIYLDLAERSLKRDEFPRIARLIDDAYGQIRVPRASEIDLAFDSRTGVLIERTKGEIRFEGQFILRDLLEAFLREPGRVFRKEDLVREVWKETYDPKIHDNKIYVTIKRLRKLLECENATTEYVLRAKTGYFLNPSARVTIDEKSIETKDLTQTGQPSAIARAPSGTEKNQ